MGAPDPRLDAHGKLDLRLRRQSRFWGKQDPPPSRVQPIPFVVLQHLVQSAYLDSTAPVFVRAVADMIVIATYYLMRPGEYCVTSTDAPHPFRIQDVRLFIGAYVLDPYKASEAQLLTATFSRLMFTTQKNSVRGEEVGLGPSGDSLFCPARALARRLLHLRAHSAPPDTPLHKFFPDPNSNKSCVIRSADITAALRRSVLAVGAQVGVDISKIDSRSLRASGAMALLLGQVDTDRVRLLGRWKSDAMLRYLHVQGLSTGHNYARAMLQGGDYSLHSNVRPAFTM